MATGKGLGKNASIGWSDRGEKNAISREVKDPKKHEERVSSILVHEGDAVDEILKAADRLKSDIIIMGAHGKGILSHTFLGTVPDKVLRRSRIPVLVVPIPKDAMDIDL